MLCILSCIWVNILNPDGTAWARVKHLQLRICVYAVCYTEHKPSWDLDLPFSLHLEVISTTNNTFILKVLLVPCQTEGWMGTTSAEPPQQLYGACKSAHVLRMDLDSFGTQAPHFALIPRSPLPSALALAPSSGSLLGQTSGVRGRCSSWDWTIAPAPPGINQQPAHRIVHDSHHYWWRSNTQGARDCG